MSSFEDINIGDKVKIKIQDRYGVGLGRSCLKKRSLAESGQYFKVVEKDLLDRTLKLDTDTHGAQWFKASELISKSEELTPSQELGYKEGDLFRLLPGETKEEVTDGDILMFHYDDGSRMPAFKNLTKPFTSPHRYIDLTKIEKVQTVAEQGKRPEKGKVYLVVADSLSSTIGDVITLYHDGFSSYSWFTKKGSDEARYLHLSKIVEIIYNNKKEEEMKIEVGDKVRINAKGKRIYSHSENNPYDEVGVVIKDYISRLNSYIVKWSANNNSYSADELELVEKATTKKPEKVEVEVVVVETIETIKEGAGIVFYTKDEKGHQATFKISKLTRVELAFGKVEVSRTYTEKNVVMRETAVINPSEFDKIVFRQNGKLLQATVKGNKLIVSPIVTGKSFAVPMISFN